MLQVGTVIDGKYKLIKPIGYGGMAAIFLAEDMTTNTFFAIKVMDKRLSHDHKFVQRFQQEARIGILLNHPNIPKVYYYGNFEGNYYIVMEYVKGISLRQYLKKNGPMQIVPAIKTVLQTLNALSYAYKQGIKAHRDIKPDNIMLDSVSHQAKVMDFGIAKTENSNLTQATMMFTTNYATPEQLMPARFKEGVDRRTDLYTVGILLYELLTGKVPFQGESQIDIAQKQIKGYFIPVQSLFPNLPLELNEILRKALHPLPAHRYQEPEELAADLKALKCSRPVSTHSIASADKILPSKNKTNPLWIALSASLAVLLFAGGSFMVVRNMIRAQYINVRVLTQPAGAQVYVNGELREKDATPANLSLLEGAHNITVVREGYEPVGRDIVLSKKDKSTQNQEIAFEMAPTDEQKSLQGIGLLKVASDPLPAKVYLNNAYIGDTPMDDYQLPPGDHTIYISKAGFFNSDTRSINIKQSKPGESPWKTSVHFLMVKIPPPPPKPTDPVPEPIYPGFLVVQTDPPHALIYIDGVMADTSPLYTQLMPGTYTIRAEKAGYAAVEQKVSIESKKEQQVNIRMVPDIDPPELVSPANKSTGLSTVTLRWKESKKADYYLLFITDALTGLRLIDPNGIKLTTNSYTVPSNYLASGRSYYWMVRAEKKPFSIPSSESWEFSVKKTDTAPPPPPAIREHISVNFIAVDELGQEIRVKDYLIYINSMFKDMLPSTIVLKRDTTYKCEIQKDSRVVHTVDLHFPQEAPDGITIRIPVKR